MLILRQLCTQIPELLRSRRYFHWCDRYTNYQWHSIIQNQWVQQLLFF
ncbi:hypothetical protein [Nostoc piscinale]|nr:hypothetical protein [Nostoc piscinale]